MRVCAQTLADPLLISINPFGWSGSSLKEKIRDYSAAANGGLLPPHIFSIARRALENANTAAKSQTIIVSGESGSGKTEATKLVLSYLAAVQGDPEQQQQQQQQNCEPIALTPACCFRN